jgi:hypothetical protein
MKTILPIQNKEDKKVNVSYGNEELKKRIGWILVCMAEHAKYELYESDVQWIEKNIATHPLFRTVHKTIEHGLNNFEYQVIFFERFLDIPGIPPRVNKLLIYEIGHCKEMNKMQNNNKVPPTQRFFCELWLQRQQAWR